MAELRHMLASAFGWTAAAGDISVKIPSGGTTYTAQIPTGTYRMLLGLGAEDFLQAFATAINTAIAATGRTLAVTLSATGHAVLAIDNNSAFDVNLTVGTRFLGFNASGVGAASHTGALHPFFAAFFQSLIGGDWRAETPGAFATDFDGRTYGVSSGVTRRRREVELAFIPRDPTYATSLATDATPAHPDDAYLGALGATGTARAWSLDDLFVAARGRLCAFAVGNYQDLRASTSSANRYHLVSLPPEVATGQVEFEEQVAGWPAWRRTRLPLVGYATTPTNTR